MSDMNPTEPFAQMEAEMVELTRSRNRNFATTLGRPDNVIPIGASQVSQRLGDLISQAQELSKKAEVLAVALSGPPMPEAHGLKVAGGKGPVTETLFTKQMSGLDELGRVLDSIGRALDRSNASLA